MMVHEFLLADQKEEAQAPCLCSTSLFTRTLLQNYGITHIQLTTKAVIVEETKYNWFLLIFSSFVVELRITVHCPYPYLCFMLSCTVFSPARYLLKDLNEFSSSSVEKGGM